MAEAVDALAIQAPQEEAPSEGPDAPSEIGDFDVDPTGPEPPSAIEARVAASLEHTFDAACVAAHRW